MTGSCYSPKAPTATGVMEALLQVVAGQGTVAVELLQQLSPDEMDIIYVPVGGGGLISGCASVLKALAPHVRVVGCQPLASNIMQQSVAAGHIVQAPSSSTLSDGTAGEPIVIMQLLLLQ